MTSQGNLNAIRTLAYGHHQQGPGEGWQYHWDKMYQRNKELWEQPENRAEISVLKEVYKLSFMEAEGKVKFISAVMPSAAPG